MSSDERDELMAAHDRGEFKILVMLHGLLNTGYDAPSLRCIVDCFPVKSVTTYKQREGRIKRTFEGKEYGIYLDHADNFSRFGFAEDIIPEVLCDGKKTKSETELIEKEKKEPKKNRVSTMQPANGWIKVQGLRIPGTGAGRF